MDRKRTLHLVIALPVLLSLAFGAFVALPQVRGDAILLKTFLITAGLLLGWAVALAIVFRAKGWTPVLAVSLLKQHYLQACAHLSILAYWGWYWRPVYDHAFLIAAQLVFAYAFDMLLQLSRHKKYTLGFGPFPIIFSINLFLWFKDDWFYDQFLIIAVGFAAKEFLRWTKGGKSVHIFNPSSFPLAIACWLLLFTHGFDITFGERIASTQFRPPYIYAFIFLVSLPGQFLFGVASMTLPAVLTMYLWGQAYFALTGTYYISQAYVPIAVFLAMHLLITDPSTSPRTELGRIFYGVAYAVTVIVLELTVQPSFPAKLMLVPALNLSVKLIDRAVQSRVLRRFDLARIAPQVTGHRRNLAYMAVWAVVFGGMISLRGIGDNFPGQDIPFWQTACKEHRKHGCAKLAFNADFACNHNCGWGCNYLAILKSGMRKNLRDEGAVEPDPQALGMVPDLLARPQQQGALGAVDVLRAGLPLFSRACELGFQPGCENVERLRRGDQPQDAPPTAADFRILLSIYKGSRLTELKAMGPSEVFAEACRHGWEVACGR